jgi:hypothetical protein
MKRLLTWCLIFCLMLNNTNTYATPIAAQIYTPSKCEEISDLSVRTDLNLITKNFLEDLPIVNFERIVSRQWQSLNLDYVIDSEIDNAVSKVKNDTGLVKKFESSWIPGKAEDLANKVTAIAFSSPLLKEKLSQLSKDISEISTDQLKINYNKSSSYAINCLQRKVSSKYSKTFANIFSQEMNITALSPAVIDSLNPNTSFIGSHKYGLVGGGIFALTKTIRKKVASTITDRVFQQVGERVLGRLGSGVIPVVGEIASVILIGSDLIQSFEGALPEIKKSLKTSEIKQKIQKEIVKTVKEEIHNETPNLAQKVSDDIFTLWSNFLEAYRSTLKLAGDSPEFKEILDKAPDSSKVFSLVDIASNKMGREQLIVYIKDGTFSQILSLPEISYEIIESNDLSTLFKWANLAGDKIEDVVRLEFYKHLSLEDLDRQLLTSILDVKDPLTISKLILLDINSIRKLLSISTQNLTTLSVHLSSQDFQRLAGYLGKLEQPQKNQLVSFLINDNSSIIKNTIVMAYIIQSHKIDAAIDFWEEKENSFLLLDGVFKMFTGSISWQLVAKKFGVPTILFFVAMPIILLISLFLMIGSWFYRQRLKTNQTKETVGELNAN